MPRGGKKRGGKKKRSKKYRDEPRAENIDKGKEEEEMEEDAEMEKVARLREITESGPIRSVDRERINGLYLKNPDCQGWPITLGQCLDDDSLMLNVFTPTRHKPDIHTFTEFGRRVLQSAFFHLALLHGSKKAHGNLTANRIIINFDADFCFKAVELKKDGEYVDGSGYNMQTDVYALLKVLRMHRDKRGYKLADDVADFIEWGEALFHPSNPNQGWYQIVKANNIPIGEADKRIAELNGRPIVKAKLRVSEEELNHNSVARVIRGNMAMMLTGYPVSIG